MEVHVSEEEFEAARAALAKRMGVKYEDAEMA